MSEANPHDATPPRPRCIPVFRLLGWLGGIAAALLALAAAAALGGLTPHGIAEATGWALLAASFLLGFAAAMLFGFAANLEILHQIRARLGRGERVD